MKYDKLVRDRVPKVIKQRGGVPVTHVASADEYLGKLKKKLKEETDEFLKDCGEEELADILEVIYAFCDYLQIEREELEFTRKRKVEERGGFRKRIILDETRENSSHL